MSRGWPKKNRGENTLDEDDTFSCETNKYRYDDDSLLAWKLELWSRSVRKFLITLSASRIPEVTTILKKIQLRPTQWWYRPNGKRSQEPQQAQKLLPKDSQACILLSSLATPGPSTGRLRGVTQKEPKWNSLLGTYLPLVSSRTSCTMQIVWIWW
jgi:hypothetical protein